MYRKSKISLLLFAALAAGAPVLAQRDTAAIAALQQQRFNAMMQKDTAYLRRCTVDGIVYVHSNGLVQDKEAFISSVGSGSIVYAQMDTKERKIRMYKNAAVVNGVIHVSGRLNGNPFEVTLRYTDVYVYRKGWKMAGWQSLKL